MNLSVFKRLYYEAKEKDYILLYQPKYVFRYEMKGSSLNNNFLVVKEPVCKYLLSNELTVEYVMFDIQCCLFARFIHKSEISLYFNPY